MANNKSSVSFIIVLVIGICIYESYNKPLEEEESKLKNEREKNEMIKAWSKPTIDFIESFNCSEYKLNNTEVQIEKFIVFDSYNYDNCLINLNNDFEGFKTFNNFYTKSIDEANVIIWIVQKPGKTEGEYSNFTKAVRYCCDLNFIDKDAKVIYKKITLDYLGNPPDEIRRRKGTAGGTEFFGTKPYEEILKLISHEF